MFCKRLRLQAPKPSNAPLRHGLHEAPVALAIASPYSLSPPPSTPFWISTPTCFLHHLAPQQPTLFLEPLRLFVDSAASVEDRRSQEFQKLQATFAEADIYTRLPALLVRRHNELLRVSTTEIRENIEILKEVGFHKLRLRLIFLSFPTVLSVSWAGALRFLTNLGISKEVLKRWVSHDPKLLLEMRRDDLSMQQKLLHKLGFSEEERLNILKLRAWFLHRDTLHAKVDLLKGLHLTNEEIRKAINSYPVFLSQDLKRIMKPAIKALHDLGLEGNDLRKVFVCRPDIFRVICGSKGKDKISFLLSLGVSRESIRKVIMKNPSFLFYSLERKLKPSVAHWESTGLTGKELENALLLQNRLVGSRVDSSGDKVSILLRYGFVEGSTKLLKAMGATCRLSADQLDARLRNLLSLGFSHEEVCKMVTELPQVLRRNEADCSQKVEYVLRNSPYSTSDIARISMFFCYDFQRRVKPRLKMLGWLKSKGLLQRYYHLAGILTLSDERFLQRFVYRWNVTSDVFDRMMSETD